MIEAFQWQVWVVVRVLFYLDPNRKSRKGQVERQTRENKLYRSVYNFKRLLVVESVAISTGYGHMEHVFRWS